MLNRIKNICVGAFTAASVAATIAASTWFMSPMYGGDPSAKVPLSISTATEAKEVVVASVTDHSLQINQHKASKDKDKITQILFGITLCSQESTISRSTIETFVPEGDSKQLEKFLNKTVNTARTIPQIPEATTPNWPELPKFLLCPKPKQAPQILLSEIKITGKSSGEDTVLGPESIGKPSPNNLATARRRADKVAKALKKINIKGIRVIPFDSQEQEFTQKEINATVANGAQISEPSTQAEIFAIIDQSDSGVLKSNTVDQILKKQRSVAVNIRRDYLNYEVSSIPIPTGATPLLLLVPIIRYWFMVVLGLIWTIASLTGKELARLTLSTTQLAARYLVTASTLAIEEGTRTLQGLSLQLTKLRPREFFLQLVLEKIPRTILHSIITVNVKYNVSRIRIEDTALAVYSTTAIEELLLLSNLSQYQDTIFTVLDTEI
jgi:hypothetical protein